MNGNATYRRRTRPWPTVGILLGAACEALAQLKCGAFRRALAVLALLLLVSPAQEAAAQQRAYVVNADSNTVSVIDRLTNRVVTTIEVGSHPADIAVNPLMARAYVANSGTNTVSVIDTISDNVVATIQVGSGPVSIAATTDGRHAYVANARTNSVSVIDTFTQTVVSTVPVGFFPNRVTLTPDGTSAYVTNALDRSVSIINTGTNTVTATVEVGKTPLDVIAPSPAPTCTDGIKNGFETDVDCGGPFCPKCANFRGCLTNSDCLSNNCNTTVTMGGPPPYTCQP